MASVSLHPIASRGGEQSSTVVSIHVDQSEEKPTSTAGGPFEDPLPAASASQSTSFCDEDALSDRPSFCSSGEATWGIQHRNLDAYPVLVDEPSFLAARCGGVEDFGPAPPIRAMTAEQFAELHAEYAALETPHSVLFPFLHGVDGDNQSQNSFFGAPPQGQPTPSYRGLTIVRADMPRADQLAAAAARAKRNRASSSASRLSSLAQEGHTTASSVNSARARADSRATVSSVRSYDSQGSRSSGEDDESTADASPWANYPLASGSCTSVTSSMASEEQSSANSIFSAQLAGSEAGSSHTSISSLLDNATPTSADGKNAAAVAAFTARTPSQGYEAQPRHSILNSTLFPGELIALTSVLIQEPDADADDMQSGNTGSSTRESSSCGSSAPCLVTTAFRDPKQAPGISLRNFRIQAVKYASISDIVIYCPAGLQISAIQCARKFREAQELQWRERLARGLGGPRYNVFVVLEPFSAFERHLPHLVAVDGAGRSRNRVDFIEREREEMQRLTAASEIDENVWMGCSADIPHVDGDDESNESVSPAQSNPLGFSVCIEANESNEIPSASRLAHAAHYLDAVEATALFELNSKAALRELDEVEVDSFLPSEDDDDRQLPSLGPQGWSPGQYTRSRKGKLRSSRSSNASHTSLPSATAHPLTPAPENLVHLEGPSSGFGLQHNAVLENAISGIIRLCAWIKKQAQPTRPPPPATPAPAHSASMTSFGILHGALRGGRGSSSPNSLRSGQSQPATQQQGHHHPRRVLLHCADGYTETSLLGLAYLMYSRGLSLPEAYLDLQHRCARSFFVYARDMPFLRMLEQRMQAEYKSRVAREREQREREHMQSDSVRSRSKHALPWSVNIGTDAGGEERGPTTQKKSSLASLRGAANRRGSNASTDSPQLAAAAVLAGEVNTSSAQSVWQRGIAAASGLVSAPIGRKLSSPAPNGLCSPSLSEGRTRTPTPRGTRSIPGSPRQEQIGSPRCSSPLRGRQAGRKTGVAQDMSWFYDARFEGSFPSRILPFLYLGNLNHALNPALLHALGITHVVSVGETALHPPPGYVEADFSSSTTDAGRQACEAFPAPATHHNSLWHEERAGRISVLDLKNVADDGIDSLQTSMQRAVEYIEAARRAGGSVLVHCRVGVSRSATVVIAYVMAHLDLNLVESYLLVRSRRLNILIQPSLLLFHDLRNFEAFLAKQKAERLREASSPGSSSRSSNDEMLLDSSMHSLTIAQATLTQSPNRSAADRHRGSTAGTSLMEVCSEAKADMALNVDLGVGAGLLHDTAPRDTSMLPFGSGSPSGIPATAMRLTWGFLCREIAALNERYSI